MSRAFILACFLSVVVLSCQNNTDSTLTAVVDDYLQTYQERNDWEKMLSFYSDSIYLEDVNLELEFNGKDAFRDFYDWPNPSFRKTSPQQKTFQIEEVAIHGQTAVIRGRLAPFYWKNDLQNWPGLFTIWLTFNEDQQIIRQYDFFKYPKSFLP